MSPALFVGVGRWKDLEGVTSLVPQQSDLFARNKGMIEG